LLAGWQGGKGWQGLADRGKILNKECRGWSKPSNPYQYGRNGQQPPAIASRQTASARHNQPTPLTFWRIGYYTPQINISPKVKGEMSDLIYFISEVYHII
jgi:hypothetical protein